MRSLSSLRTSAVQSASAGLRAMSSTAQSSIVTQHQQSRENVPALPTGAPAAAHQFSVRTLLEARVHMGHRVKLWHPSMAPYILGARNNMHIINLDRTIVLLRRALAAVSSMAEDGCSFLWLGPGDLQKHRLVTRAAARAGAYTIDGRWIGGTLTNAVESGQARKFDYRLPDCVFVIDMLRHAPALHEARTVGIPVVGIADSDCNPDLLTYPIPGNDDGVYAINLYCHLMRLAIADGRRRASVNTTGAPSQRGKR
jgi:small subunit ribosomal protein S2